MALNITQLLEKMIEKGASDLLLSTGAPPVIRVKTEMYKLEDYEILRLTDMEALLHQILDEDQFNLFEVNKDLDFTLGLGDKARFRVNAFYQRGSPSVALRAIPARIPTLKDLNLPDVFEKFCEIRQGLILIVGPANTGKSTTIASMINHINNTRSEHIITLEDPIEFSFTNNKSLIEQREMYVDVHSWEGALRSILRQDPNVILIGELRDKETVASALEISETGHLVFATLHTNSAAQTLDRLLSAFSAENKGQICNQLAAVLELVISQRLVKTVSGEVLPALEILLPTDAVKNLIREGKTHLLQNTMMTSSQVGMKTLNRSLADMVITGAVSAEEAALSSPDQAELLRLIRQKD